MAKRKAFLIRVDPALLDALQRWADDDLRSLNGQIEYLLRGALSKAGRVSRNTTPSNAPVADLENLDDEIDDDSLDHPGTDHTRHPGS